MAFKQPTLIALGQLKNNPPMTILTLTPLPFGCYVGKIIVDGCMYAGTFAGEMKVGNTIINFNTIKRHPEA